MRLVSIHQMTPTARAAYVAVMTHVLQHGVSVEEGWKYGAKMFSRWLSNYEKQEIEVTPEAMAGAIPFSDNTMPTKVMIGLLVSAAILDGMREGKATSEAVENAFKRFQVHAPASFVRDQIATFEKERERLLQLKPHQMDDGAGGSVDIVVVPEGVDIHDQRKVEAFGRLTDKKDLQAKPS